MYLWSMAGWLSITSESTNGPVRFIFSGCSHAWNLSLKNLVTLAQPVTEGRVKENDIERHWGLRKTDSGRQEGQKETLKMSVWGKWTQFNPGICWGRLAWGCVCVCVCGVVCVCVCVWCGKGDCLKLESHLNN